MYLYEFRSALSIEREIAERCHIKEREREKASEKKKGRELTFAHIFKYVVYLLIFMSYVVYLPIDVYLLISAHICSYF